MNAPVVRHTTLLPHELPETFAMDAEGTCLEPKVMNGAKLLFSRDAAYVPGDLVCLFIRPEFVKPGEHQMLVKQLVFAPGRGYWRNPASYAGSDIKPTVIVDMLNPFRRLYIKPEALYGIYKCLGPFPSNLRAVPVSDEELKFKAAASMGEHSITRRSALALTASSLTAALAGAADATENFSFAGGSDIEALYARWLAIRNRNYASQTEAECEASYAQYRALQDKMLARTPTTARELALQYVADTDCRESECSDDFDALIDRLTGAVEVSHSEQPELPVAKVNRLAKELARAMDEWCADLGSQCGIPDPWKAHIYPASYTRYPITFEALDDGRHADDPLLDAVLAYKTGLDAFNAARGLTDEQANAFIEHSYGPPMEALEEWAAPPRTRAGAIAALRMALREAEDFCSSTLINSMLEAALAYLDPTDAVTI